MTSINNSEPFTPLFDSESPASQIDRNAQIVEEGQQIVARYKQAIETWTEQVHKSDWVRFYDSGKSYYLMGSMNYRDYNCSYFWCTSWCCCYACETHVRTGEHLISGWTSPLGQKSRDWWNQSIDYFRAASRISAVKIEKGWYQDHVMYIGSNINHDRFLIIVQTPQQ